MSTQRTGTGQSAQFADSSGALAIGARTTRSTNQTIADVTLTDISFDTSVYADGVTFASGINPFTIVTAGKYQIDWGFVWASNAAGTIRRAQLVLNGATVIDYDARIPLTAGNTPSIKGAVEYSLSISDTIGFQVFQDSGSPTDVLSLGTYSPFITIRKVG